MALQNVGDAPLVTYTTRNDATGVPEAPASVSATLTDPAGSVTTLPVTTVSPGVYTVRPALTAEGQWLVTFTAAGGGYDDVETVAFYAVGASGQHPAWAPTVRDVGDHIPTRTRPVGVDVTYAGTFTEDTTPTGEQVTRLIGRACSVVAADAGTPVVPAAYPLLAAAAALWAAYWVELAYPERDGDIIVYDRLRADAVEATTRAGTVNRAGGGGGSSDPDGATVVLPVASFPDPPGWADKILM